ncbi:glycosyltransferase family 2 protein [Williamsia sp.]|uniref:glycosyltransferase family 2 protein n=1 Tax=Williamsia sp. TaxID=1872085 RepID=UPI001A336EBF|nr:glycosyltransferase family 2 protein [Williamsia sp.]MBJ7288261.1 glycosyltransferase family 2 protein [Williamsia sp.]
MPISVVLPAFNEEAGIVACLERLIRQGEAVAEIIVVNNNSTDSTADLVADIAQRDSRVRMIDETKAGVSYARYAGFDEASQDVIACIDSDTQVAAGWADAIEQIFADHAEISAGGAPMIMHDLPFQKHFERRWDRVKRVAATRLAAGRPIPLIALSGANSAIRRCAWETIRDRVSYRRDVFEDLDRSLHLKAAGFTLVLIPGMDATVSGRRLLTGPREFLRYVACGARTYRLHGKNGMALLTWITGTVNLVRMAVLLPANRAWDPQTGRFSIEHLRSHREVRESPIKAGLD